MDNIKKLKRGAQLVTILTKYGFETLVTETDIKKLIPDHLIQKSEKAHGAFSFSVYERIRMVLEDLGPTYIKLGQLLSNRDDLLPDELIVELQKLQDDVPARDIDVYATLRNELSIVPEEVFESIDSEPIAAASLSQVYTALLRDGKKIIIKVKREGIREIIEADLLIMKDVAKIFERYYDMAKKLGLSSIVSAFEKSIIAELSFVQECANIERFRANFQGCETIYVPATYKELSNHNILCMEFIDGIKISDKQQIEACGLNAQQVADTVVDLYMRQIVDYGFFHADPHSGNIFVLPTGKIAFIDYGSVGRMLPKDKEYLGNFVIHALRKDTKRLIRVIKKIAVKYDIPNENALEYGLYDILDILDSNSIKDLSLKDITRSFSRLLNDNRIVLPDYIYLLARGIVLLEGIGRELGIESNIIESVKPYGSKLGKERLSPKYLTNKALDKLYDLGDRLEEIPGDIHSLVQKVNNDELKMSHTVKGLTDIKDTINRLVIAIMIASLTVGSSILVLADMPPKAWGVSVLGFLGFVFSGIMAVILILVILRNKQSE